MSRFHVFNDSLDELLIGIGDQLAETVKPLKMISLISLIFFKPMNELYKKCHGEMITLVRSKSVVTSFIEKLSFYKQNLGRNILFQCPNLS